MRLSGALLLISLIVSVVTPLAIRLSISSGTRTASIVTLDVCHAAASVLSVNADTASLHECSCNPVPLEIATLLEAHKALFVTSLFSVQRERPPKV